MISCMKTRRKNIKNYKEDNSEEGDDNYHPDND